MSNENENTSPLVQAAVDALNNKSNFEFGASKMASGSIRQTQGIASAPKMIAEETVTLTEEQQVIVNDLLVLKEEFDSSLNELNSSAEEFFEYLYSLNETELSEFVEVLSEEDRAFVAIFANQLNEDNVLDARQKFLNRQLRPDGSAATSPAQGSASLNKVKNAAKAVKDKAVNLGTRYQAAVDRIPVLGRVSRAIDTGVGKVVQKVADTAGKTKLGQTAAARALGRGALKVLPVAGAGFYGYDAYKSGSDAIDRVKKGDYAGAALSGLSAASSGAGAALSLIPGVGTVGALIPAGVSAGLEYVRDKYVSPTSPGNSAAAPAATAPAAPARSGRNTRGVQTRIDADKARDAAAASAAKPTGPMSDEQKYGKTGAEIIKLGGMEAYKNRPKDAKGNVDYLKQLRSDKKASEISAGITARAKQTPLTVAEPQMIAPDMSSLQQIQPAVTLKQPGVGIFRSASTGEKTGLRKAIPNELAAIFSPRSRAEQKQKKIDSLQPITITAKRTTPAPAKKVSGPIEEQSDANYDMINRDALPVPSYRNIRGVQDRINADARRDRNKISRPGIKPIPRPGTGGDVSIMPVPSPGMGGGLKKLSAKPGMSGRMKKLSYISPTTYAGTMGEQMMPSTTPSTPNASGTISIQPSSGVRAGLRADVRNLKMQKKELKAAGKPVDQGLRDKLKAAKEKARTARLASRGVKRLIPSTAGSVASLPASNSAVMGEAVDLNESMMFLEQYINQYGPEPIFEQIHIDLVEQYGEDGAAEVIIESIVEEFDQREFTNEEFATLKEQSDAFVSNMEALSEEEIEQYLSDLNGEQIVYAIQLASLNEGFFKKIFKKVGKALKKVAKVALPIAAGFLLPGVGGAIAGKLGSTALGTAVKGIGSRIASSALGRGVAALGRNVVGKTLLGAAKNAVTQGALSKLQGGSFSQGAKAGAIGSVAGDIGGALGSKVAQVTGSQNIGDIAGSAASGALQGKALGYGAGAGARFGATGALQDKIFGGIEKRLAAVDDEESDEEKQRRVAQNRTASSTQAMAAESVKLDPVGREDADVNNDGKQDKTDVYLARKREKIGDAIAKRLGKK